jgi:hypothetical protein
MIDMNCQSFNAGVVGRSEDVRTFAWDEIRQAEKTFAVLEKGRTRVECWSLLNCFRVGIITTDWISVSL